MVYYSRRQCSNPDDCAESADAQTPSPTVERVLQTMAPSSAPDDHKILRAYIVLALNLILFAVLARAGYRALMRPRAPPARPMSLVDFPPERSWLSLIYGALLSQRRPLESIG